MSRWRRTLLLIGIWSVPACLMVVETRTMAHMAGARPPTFRLTIPTILEWYLWIPLTPLVLRLGARFPLNRTPIAARSVAVHLTAAVAATVLHGIVYSEATFLLATRPPATTFWLSTLRISIGWFPFGVVIYGAVVAAAAALDFARRLGERETAAARLGEQLARARLDAIRARIHPHFLFNALHSVGALVRTGARDDAVRIVVDLGDLLREVLAQDVPDLVRLAVELSFVRRYLDIESIRFSNRLRVEWNVDETIGDALVPPMLVQALVENAIHHGIARSGTAGQLAITVRADDDVVEISITDDGPGPSSANVDGDCAREDTHEHEHEHEHRHTRGGFGLDAARQRLQALLGPGADVGIEPARPTGTVARIRMPLRRQHDVATATATATAAASLA